MQLPVEQFPILSAGQMNPFHQALQTGLQDYQQNMQNAYLPYQLQADVASKQAYSQNIGRQIAATVLGNPLAIATMSNEQRNALLGQLTGAPQNINTPFPGQSNNQGGGLWDSFKSMIGANAPTQSPAVSAIDQANISKMQPGDSYVVGSGQSPSSQNNNQGSLGMTSDIPPNGNGAYPSGYANQAYIDKTTGLDLSDPRMNLYGRDFGSPAANSAMASTAPSPYQKLEIKKREASISTGAEQQGKSLQKLQDDSNKSGQNAFNLLLDADKFHQAYQNATIKGPWVGVPGVSKLAQFDPNSRVAMNSANNMAVQLAAQLFGGRQSDYREKLAQNLKLDLTMPEKTEQTVMNGIKAMGQRSMEQSDFNDYLINTLGITDPNKVNNMWLDYNRDRPFYDVNSKSIIKQNLGSYKDYISNKMGGGSSNSSNAPAGSWPMNKDAINEDKVQGQVPPKGTAWMIRPDGMKVPVHQSNIQMAKDQYKFREVN
jgi:hypothetical protein